MSKEIIRYYLLYFISTLISLGTIVGQPDSLHKELTIIGTIEGANSLEEISFRFYKEYLTFEELIYAATIINDTFKICVPLEENAPGFLVYREENIPIFLEDGDSITLKSKADSFLDSLAFSGRGALRNQYLKQSFLQFDLNDSLDIETEIAKNTASNYQQLMQQHRAAKLSFLDDFLQKRDTFFSPSFYEYIQADINYWWANNLMRYRNEHPVSDIFPIVLSMPESYFQFMDSLPLNNERVLNNLNYLFYLDHYAKWRQEKIEKGMLKFKNIEKTKKKLVKVKAVETYGQVLMDKLAVRKQAHDEQSVFEKLERGTEVRYLQDITNDRFLYPYDGHKYSDYFIKIETPNGQKGWVFKGGIYLKEKIVFAKKWIEIPDATPAVMRNFKYANFKGKVLEYAIARDLYWNTVSKRNHDLLIDYLEKSSNSTYANILKNIYEEAEKDSTLVAQRISKAPFSIPKNKIDSSASIAIFEEITSTTAYNLQTKGQPKSVDALSENSAEKIPNDYSRKTSPPSSIVISTPDFSKFVKKNSITGKVGRATLTRPEIVINTNPLLREGTSFPFPDATATHFHYDISLKSSTTGYIKMGNQQLNIYLKAGDNLDIQVNGNNLYDAITFGGKAAKINNYFLASHKEFRDIELELKAKIRYGEPVEFKEYLKELKLAKLAFLRNYLQSNTLAVHEIKYAKADIEYWYAFNLMNYPYEHPIFHDLPSPMSVPDDYYDFLEEIPVNNNGALPNPYYIYYIQDYLSFQSEKADNKGLSRYQLADKFLKGKPLYFYKALQYSLDIRQKDSRELVRNIHHFINNCPYKLYAEYVKLAYHESKGLILGMEAPNFRLTDINGSTVNLANLRDKVVFLDFWATWCVPCVHQLPSHRKLQNLFEQEEVVFVYVSVDKNNDAWQKFVKTRSLPGIHLSAGMNMFKSSVAKKYKVSSLPYTLLIDKEGRIVWHHVGGYSVQKVGSLIAQLLQ